VAEELGHALHLTLISHHIKRPAFIAAGRVPHRLI
jgi:hypothetical protein